MNTTPVCRGSDGHVQYETVAGVHQRRHPQTLFELLDICLSDGLNILIYLYIILQLQHLPPILQSM
jgi:hypothetical protein